MAIDDKALSSPGSSMLEARRTAAAARSSSGVNSSSSSSDAPYIHSGHFMLSRVHDESNDDDGAAIKQEDKHHDDESGFDFLSANTELSQTYKFGPRSTQTLAIDASLSKLFQCMTLAYSGKITSPKWKPFKGMPMSGKEKVRLNNIIWREWHMQYIQNKKPIVCQFATPLSDDVHTKPEAVVLEGKYWKRRLDTVTAEYKRWRKYFKSQHARSRRNSSENTSQAEFIEWFRDTNVPMLPVPFMSSDQGLGEDFMDFSDAIFSLNQPFAFPNPRELSQSGYADLIQPGLVQLQPNLDDFMDTLDPLQEILNNSKSSFGGNTALSPVLESTSSFQSENTGLILPMDTDIALSQTDHPGSQNLLPQDHQLINTAVFSSAASTPVSTTSNVFNTLSNFSFLPSFEPTTNMDSSIVGDQSQFSVSHMSQSTASPGQNFSSTSVNKKITAGGTNLLPRKATDALTGSINRNNNMSKIQPRKNLLPQLHNQTLPQKTLLNNPMAALGTAQTFSVSASNKKPSLVASSQKKNASFAVPMGTPIARNKHRPITPAPSPNSQSSNPSSSSSSSSSQHTFLAQLLTTGKYPGAVDVKKEPSSLKQCVISATPPYQPIRPAEPHVAVSPSVTLQAPSSIAINLTPVSAVAPMATTVPDFSTSVLLAAATQAFGSTGVRDVISFAPASKQVVSTAASGSGSKPGSPSTPIGSPRSPGQAGDSLSFSSLTPQKSLRSKTDQDREQYREYRRASHITAEQKRRCNIKSGFDMLHSLIPSLSQNPTNKVSKAAMLQKAAEYCKKLKCERSQMQNEAEILKHEIESLNSDISICQAQLPATGVPVTRQRVDQMKEMFEEYVQSRTMQNWKFWIFSIIIRPLFDSFNNLVSTASIDELCRTALTWLDQHCSLVALRPTVLNALRHLSTTTSILSDPSKVPEQATQAVTKQRNPDQS